MQHERAMHVKMRTVPQCICGTGALIYQSVASCPKAPALEEVPACQAVYMNRAGRGTNTLEHALFNLAANTILFVLHTHGSYLHGVFQIHAMPWAGGVSKQVGDAHAAHMHAYASLQQERAPGKLWGRQQRQSR